MHLYHFLQDATLVMVVLLGMVRRKVHAQQLTKYARMMALVQVRAITAIDSKIVYNIITIILYCRLDFINMECISIISCRMQQW